MKKFLVSILALMLAFGMAISMVGCSNGGDDGDGDGDGMTRAEYSALYKDIAVELWESLGISDPTAPAETSLMTAVLPDITTATTDPGEIANIITNANTTAGIFYMISLLYENDDFVLTNGIAHFEATCTVTTPAGTMNNDYVFKMKPTLDVENNKVILELTSFVMGMTQYSYMDMNFNFEDKSLVSYDFYTMIVEAEMVVGMSLTEDGKYLFDGTDDLTNPFAVGVIAYKDAFVASAESAQKLDGDFNAEMQAYFDVLNDAMADLG
jgi:hypothetical protein